MLLAWFDVISGLYDAVSHAFFAEVNDKLILLLKQIVIQSCPLFLCDKIWMNIQYRTYTYNSIYFNLYLFPGFIDTDVEVATLSA